MAIIELSSGRLTDTPKDDEVNSTVPQESRIIDLNTGQFKAASSVQPQPSNKQSQSPLKSSISDFMTGSDRIERTPELGTLPEFGTTEEGDTPRIALGLLSTFDSKAQQEIIQQAIPEAAFETTEDGSVIIEVPAENGDTRRSVLNRPGFSPQDASTAVAQVLSFIGPARLANLGKTLLQKVAIGSAGAGLTEQLMQELGVVLGRKERDPVSTAIATATGGLAELVVPAVQGVRGMRQAERMVEGSDEIAQVSGNIATAREASKQTNIPLFQAQQTGIPAQLEKQSFVAQLPAGTQSAVTGLKAQNRAAGEAVEKFINSIAPDDSVITGANKVRTAAQQAVENAKIIRQEKASPLYNKAFQERRVVNTNPVKELIKDKLLDTPKTGQIAVNLKKVSALIEDSPNLKNLHNAKIEIDQIINSRGMDAVGGTTKKELADVQRLLLEQMDSSSPTYKSARAAFESASPPVTAIQESIIGKIANLDDTQLKQASMKIFDPSQTNPKVIADAKKAITDVNPEAWDEIIRVELERRLGSVKSTMESGTVENIPGQLFRAIFPNDKSTKVLLNGLDDNGKANLKFLQTALKRASLGRPGGSQTAARKEISDELRGGVVNTLRNLFSKPITTIASAGEDVAFNKRVTTLSKALFDPTWKAEMKSIIKLNSDSPAAGIALAQLFDDIESTEAKQ